MHVLFLVLKLFDYDPNCIVIVKEKIIGRS